MDAGNLYRLICKVMNGSNNVQDSVSTALESSYNLHYVYTPVVCKVMNGSNNVQDSVSTALESSYNLYYSCNQDYGGLAHYAEAFHHCNGVVERAGCYFDSEKLRDNCIENFVLCKDT